MNPKECRTGGIKKEYMGPIGKKPLNSSIILLPIHWLNTPIKCQR